MFFYVGFFFWGGVVLMISSVLSEVTRGKRQLGEIPVGCTTRKSFELGFLASELQN